MKAKIMLLSLIFSALLMTYGSSGFAMDAQQTEWLKNSKLGPYSSATQDWKSIEEAAKKEGKVVIFSLSSRIFKLQKEFNEKYGIEIVAYDLSSGIQLERFKREHRAGRYTVDVLFNRDIPTLLNDFLPKKLVWNFVPDSVASQLSDDEKEPLLIQRWSSRIFFYNSALNPVNAPMDNLWDLTRSEWRGKVLLLDPLSSAADANVFQTILQHPKEMAEAYQKEFGEKISYSKDLVETTTSLGIEANAANEWLYRLLNNKPTFLGSTTTVYKNIGDIKQKTPPVGISTFSKLRTFKKAVYEAQPMYNLAPVSAVSSQVVLGIADRAPHPNAAKLLIRYMMEEGFRPWNEAGDYAARNDVMEEQIKKYGIPNYENLSKWVVDAEYVDSTRYEFLELFINLR